MNTWYYLNVKTGGPVECHPTSSKDVYTVKGGDHAARVPPEYLFRKKDAFLKYEGDLHKQAQALNEKYRRDMVLISEKVSLAWREIQSD